MNVFRRPIAIATSRCISTSATCHGKRNFRKFLLYNKRGTKIYKQQLANGNDNQFPFYSRGVRDIGYHSEGQFVVVPEMIPDLIVPDLSGFELKPYVSYRAPDVYQSEFTAQDLFDAVYSSKIVDDYKHGNLDSDGNPVSPSPEESMTPEEAKREARKTGSDIFCD